MFRSSAQAFLLFFCEIRVAYHCSRLSASCAKFLWLKILSLVRYFIFYSIKSPQVEGQKPLAREFSNHVKLTLAGLDGS